MTIPVYLVTAQWALLFALGLLVIVMYRQLGRHLNPAEPATALGPAVGSRAVGFEYTRVSDATAQRFMPGNGRAAMVAFVDPTCPACEELVAALGEADANGELGGARTLLLVSDPASYLQISEPFRTTRLEVGRVVANATLEAYGASGTPLLIAIDSAGVVRAAGSVSRLADVRGFTHAFPPTSPDDTMPLVGPAASERTASRRNHANH